MSQQSHQNVTCVHRSHVTDLKKKHPLQGSKALLLLLFLPRLQPSGCGHMSLPEIHGLPATALLLRRHSFCSLFFGPKSSSARVDHVPKHLEAAVWLALSFPFDVDSPPPFGSSIKLRHSCPPVAPSKLQPWFHLPHKRARACWRSVLRFRQHALAAASCSCSNDGDVLSCIRRCSCTRHVVDGPA